MKKAEALLAWLDSRTGYKQLLNEALYENVPGGARWRYVWGSTLTFTFFVQVITGIFLWMAYSPNSHGAWESVFYIQNQMWGGWLLRGIHHFTAQAMTILLVLHLLQVVIDGAYKAPREMNYLFGMVLLVCVLGLSLTGYLLPWDQKGYWATKVATNIIAVTPFIGPALQKIVIGGNDYGHLTLTRFFAIHAGVLPGLMIFFIALHVYLFRKHGLHAKEPKRKPDAKFWPDQVLMDAVACLAVMTVVLFFVLKPRLFDDGMPGAHLGPPADPTEAYSAARPEWYFMFLFQFLKAEWLVKLFGHNGELVGAIIIPSIAITILAAMPFIGKWKLGHRFNLGFLAALFAGAGLLTYLSFAEDRGKPEFAASVKQAEHESERLRHLALANGIPQEGAVALMRRDPLLEGPKLFAKNCASCHRYDGHDGMGNKSTDGQTAPELKGVGSREWLAAFLDPKHIATSNFYGSTRFANTKMVKFVQKDVAEFNAAQKEQLRAVIAAVSAEAALPTQRSLDANDKALIETGRIAIRNEAMRCIECHQFRKEDDAATAPDLTGYASREWLMAIISDPKHPRFYGRRNDRMPSFGEEKILTREQIGLLADWLRGDVEIKVVER
ncbi:MAG TPA: cytochrome b N-terminal domain-containing protein [Candidatus Acidoferrum sp.]|nr:cytochrome b N-terminal domain-containing protein [Candidatus Acidoferrum sp.]